MNYVDYYINYFEQNLLLSQESIVAIRKECLRMLKESNLERNELIKVIATFARRKLALNDNKNLMYILERSGIYILEKNLGA